MHHLLLVVPAQPCTACAMLCQLSLEICEKTAHTTGAAFSQLILSHPSELAQVEGLEVETLPALLLDGRQITAGQLPDRRALVKY